ncbi:MAG: GIY-YIG nuclease family protein, partial [Bacteroidetes bacterium]|nr:GIY-YIG nuclease family protein [Bacteroidota bacterium]
SGRHYYGHTSDLKDRIKSHNSSQNRFTRGKGPWILIGFIECHSKSEAVKIEQKLKKMKNPSRAIHWLRNRGTVR